MYNSLALLWICLAYEYNMYFGGLSDVILASAPTGVRTLALNTGPPVVPCASWIGAGISST